MALFLFTSCSGEGVYQEQITRNIQTNFDLYLC